MKLNPKSTKWKKLSSGGDIRTFEKPGQTVMGLYDGSEMRKVEDRETHIHFFKDGKDRFGIWENKVLEKLRDVKKGCPVKVVFLGLAGKGRRKYRNFDVFTA